MTKNEFPQDKEYELSLLLDPAPNFQKLTEYLDGFIKTALGKFELSEETYNALYHALRADIPVAAERYLKSKSREKDYKFSAYFSWYISEWMKKIPGLKRKVN